LQHKQRTSSTRKKALSMATVVHLETSQVSSETYDAAVAAAERILAAAKSAVRGKIESAGHIDKVQHAAHGLAWFATYVESLRQMRRWAQRLEKEGRAGEFERLILAAAFSEYLAQIAGGIPMSQGEIVRLGQLGVSADEITRFQSGAVAALIDGASADDSPP
jgi:(2S)-methylsuccinyl-CoA dehydrogenase